MPDSLSALQDQKTASLRKISVLGDFRPSSITTGRSGNSHCHCHQPGDPGHGPNFRLTYKDHGKTITESFPHPAAQRKAEREIREYHEWQQLSRDFVEVNTAICRLPLHFPEAIQIVDLYHARQHLWELTAKLYPNDSPRQRRWMMAKQDKLDSGKIQSLVASLRPLATSHPGLMKQIRAEADYFQRKAERMRYPQFRRQKLFVGSGVIKAGCKTIIGTRLKQSGMFWTLRGANAIIALRCCRLSGDLRTTGNPTGVDLTYMSRAAVGTGGN